MFRVPSPIEDRTASPVDVACQTLARASVFLGMLDCAPGQGINTRREDVRSRFLGNSLRELDRFLNLALNESAALAGQAGQRQSEFVRRRNSANKLTAVRTMRSLGCPEHGRLMAIGRVRECLASCAGRVHTPDLWADLAQARSGARPPSAAEDGQGRLILLDTDLRPICAFYGEIADTLASEVRRAA